MSGGELVIIFIVAFLVFGPEKLPELARTLGKWLFEIKKAAQDVKEHVETELDAVEKEAKEGKSAEDALPHEKPGEGSDKTSGEKT